MAADDWAGLNLLWRPDPTSHNNQARGLLTAIAGFTIHPSANTVWRGHSSHLYRLAPSGARGADWNDPACSQVDLNTRTAGLLAEAIEASQFWRDGIQYRTLTPLEQLSHLQHHSGGTPLIDLTPDPMVALWMACERSRANAPANLRPNDGLLLGFNVDARWTDVSHEQVDHPQLLANLAGTNQVGWSIPPVVNDRIVVQRSRFLISRLESAGRWHERVSDVWLPPLSNYWQHGSAAQQRDRLNRLFNPTSGRPLTLPVVAFLIPGALKSHLLDVLSRHYGISRRSVYPDAFAIRHSALG